MVNKKTTRSKSCVRRSRGRNSSRSKGSKRSLSSPSKNVEKPSGITILETPISSPIDPRQYEIVRLDNGLTAILVSDCAFHCQRQKKKDTNCVDARITRFNRFVLGLGKSRACKSSKCNIAQTCKGMKIGLNPDDRRNCSKTKFHQASVSLSVGVGSFQDPRDCFGLAHLCEHLLFLGSKKYPLPQYLDQHLDANGGEMSNAMTSGNSTTFFFSLPYDPEAFEMSLDIFSNSFIAPVVTASQIEKELRIIDSEFQEKRSNEYEWMMQILQNSGKPFHPVCQFNWGNKLTLKPPGRTNSNLLSLFKKFQQEGYDPGHMTLAIEAPEPLNKIREWVVNYFAKIARPKIRVFSLPQEPFPFDTNEFRRFYFVKTATDFNLLYVTWELPAEAQKNYIGKPMDYISRIFSSKSKGSLGSYLLQRYFISHLDTRLGISPYKIHDYSVLYHIVFHMTSLGMKNIPKILSATFAYIRYHLENGPQEYLFRELQGIRVLDFHYRKQKSTMELDHNLRLYPPKHVLIGCTLPLFWDPSSIQTYLEMLIPSKANFMVMSKFVGSCDRVEPFFESHYRIQDVSPDLLKMLESARIRKEFKRISRNSFIPTSFCEVKNENGNTSLPSVIFRSTQLEIWHFMGYSQNCFATYYLSILTPYATQDQECSVMMDIFLQIICSILKVRLHDAMEVKAVYKLKKTDHGFTILVQGFSHKIERILYKILDVLFDRQWVKSRAFFNSALNALMQRYSNALLNPEKLNENLCNRVCQEKFWIPSELRSTLGFITFKDFTEFVKKLKSKLNGKGLVFGNVTKKAALKFACKVARKLLHCQEIETLIPITAYQLPLGERVLRVKNINPSSKTSCVSNYYQIWPASTRSSLLCDFFENAMQVPAFHQLREVEKLCYNVTVSTERILSTLGFQVTILYQSEQYSGTYVKSRIDNFVEDFYENHVKYMSPTEFEDARQSILYSNDGDQTNVWNEIESQTFNFRRGNAEEETMATIEVHDIKAWFETFLLPHGSEFHAMNNSKMRKLSVQVVGNEDIEFPIRYVQGENLKRNQRPNKIIGQDQSLIILLPEADSPTRNTCISNIAQFQKTLFKYPAFP